MTEGSKKPTVRWLAICFAAALAWAVFLATKGSTIGNGELQVPSLTALPVNVPADFRWTLLDLDGQPVEFSKYRGRPILLNIWATWCGPCLMEMPSIDKLASHPRLKDKGIVFLCVATDNSGPELKAFLNDKKWRMKILRVKDMSIPPAFLTETIPATFLIAPDGRIMTAELGPAQWDDPSVIDYLEKLAQPTR